VTPRPVKSGRWYRPAQSADDGADRPGADPVLGALARAVPGVDGQRFELAVEQQRLARRSSIYVVRAQPPDGEAVWWVLKQPHLESSMEDADPALSAHEQLVALERLQAHFERLNVPFRVPAPVMHVPEIDAFAMEYVSGRTIQDLLSVRTIVRPAVLLDGLAAAGTFLRHLHALEVLPPAEVHLKQQADDVLAVAEDKLHPLGLSLPDRVRHTLLEFPSLRVASPRVRLHGDFVPTNILRTDDGCTVGLDPSLQTVGCPEDDLVRFVAIVSGRIQLAPEIVAPPFGRIRRELEGRLLGSYYDTSSPPPLFELKLLHQLCRRWCRLRELAQLREQRGLGRTRVRIRFEVLGRQMRLLMSDSERRLVRSIGGL